MGVDHGGKGQVPRIWNGDANANCFPRFCHIGTKMSVLWPSKYAKIRFRPGLCPGPRWGSSRRSPTPPLPIFHPTRHRPTLGARHASPRIPARSTPIILRVEMKCNYRIVFTIQCDMTGAGGASLTSFDHTSIGRHSEKKRRKR